MKKVFIIAEAGVNHNGDMSIAKKMVDAAVEAGADAVKFQTFKTEKLVSINAPKAEYQKRSTECSENQYEMIKRLELDRESHEELIDYCKHKEIMFLSSPFDLESIELLEELGIGMFKIPSGEITNLPYLRKIGRIGKKVILSTGMSTIGEVKTAVGVLKGSGATDISLLHCNTEYPTPMEDVNLRAMRTMKEAFKVKVGYSDHTLGIEVPVAAVAMGAEIIEKHFTLDKNMEGPDHRASLDPEELGRMVEAVRNIENAIGDGIKGPSRSEMKNRDIARKSIVANCNIKKGELFTEKNLGIKRPGNGISPLRWDEVVGKISNKDYLEDEMIEL